LAALHAACFPAPWSADEITRLLAMPGAFAAIARLEEAPCGFHLSRYGGGEAEIITIGVHPQARRSGVGRILLQDVVDRAQALGAATLFVEVAENNSAALALYRTAGLAAVGRRPGYYASETGARDALVMRADVGAD
jgi:ribosomal-protein-alanine N-acetyltransferase